MGSATAVQVRDDFEEGYRMSGRLITLARPVFRLAAMQAALAGPDGEVLRKTMRDFERERSRDLQLVPPASPGPQPSRILRGAIVSGVTRCDETDFVHGQRSESRTDNSRHID